MISNFEHHRRSIRLNEYNYGEPGLYFVTICTENRECLFGEIINGEIILNKFGQIVKNEWSKTPTIRSNIKLDEFIIMPNHLHGIIIITDTNGRGVLPYAPSTTYAPLCGQSPEGILPTSEGVHQYAPTTNKLKSPSHNIGAIVRGLKSTTTKQINILRNAPGAPVWQRNYYERIIRDEKELNNTRKYIIENPIKWPDDIENIKNI